jgi:flagellar basal body rod protein FlgG
MNVSLYQAAAALSANSRWQDVISSNLASSSIPGFKKQELSLAAVRAGLMPSSGLNAANLPQFFTVPKASSSASFISGDMKATGDKHDVAIEGKGFFSVQMPSGATAFTRDGEFQVNAKGVLVTKEGYVVKGEAGPIILDPGNPAPLSIAPSGEVSQGANEAGKIKLTEFVKPELLTQISGAYFISNPKQVTQPSTSVLHQAYLEGSNVSVVGEMANMITAMRSFEANQHIIQMQDDRLGKTIADLGNPS